MNEDQIAALTAAELGRRKLLRNTNAAVEQEACDIIKSAIEKATIGLREPCPNCGVIRAAHASELKLDSLSLTRTPDEQAEIESGQHASEQEFIQCPSCGWHPVRKHEAQSADTKRLDWLGHDYSRFDERIVEIWKGRKAGLGFREAIDAAMSQPKEGSFDVKLVSNDLSQTKEKE